jgi:nucleoside-diphosphate-sugar epimerase
MLKDEKILITGITSGVAGALADSLVGRNEVWGIARFSGDPAVRSGLDARGIKTAAVDIGEGDLSSLPDDFTYVLHLAYFRSPEPDFERAFRVNGSGTGHVFSHCRKAKAALYMSSHVIYSVVEDPWHAKRETDHIGAARPGYSQTSMVSKIAGEAVARYASREFDLPMVVARLNAPYGLFGGLPVSNVDQVVAGKSVFARWDPEPYTPIHIDDMCEQLPALLDAASVGATIVNWGGDEAVSVQQWCAWAGEWSGKTPIVDVRPPPFSLKGSCGDNSLRKSITGPCRTPFKDGLRKIYEARYGAPKAGG